MTSTATIRAIALTTTFFTGLSALVYEITWQYYLANLLGSQARSTAIIVATFLGSLALGYHIFGKISKNRSPKVLVQLCGALEVGIGVWALLFSLIYSILWSVRLLLPAASEALIGDILFACILIAPPATAMGATLPLLTQGLSKDLADAPRFHTHIYTVNTVGAFLGSLIAAFILIPALGLYGTMVAGALVNLVAGSLLWRVGSRLTSEHHSNALQDPPTDTSTHSATENVEKTIEPLIYQAIAALAGFVSISLQTAMVRVTALSVGSSTYAFSLVVGVCIVLLAVGAWLLAEKWGRRSSLIGVSSSLGVGLLLLYLAIPRLPYYSHVLRTLLTSQAPNFWIYHGLVFLGLSVLLAIPIGANGALLPLLFRDAKRNTASLGATVGILYGRNAIGCVLGAVVGGYLSLYYLDLPGVMRGIIICSALCTGLAVLVAPGGITLMRALIPLGTLAAAFILPQWPQAMMGSGTFRNTVADKFTYDGYQSFFARNRASLEIMGYDDDPNSTIMVQGNPKSARSIIVNGKSDGTTRGSDRITTLLVGHLPSLLQQSLSKEVVVIGFGTGITAGALARTPEYNRVHVLEISPAVRNFAPFFDSENGNASQSPKLEWHVGDAYRYLLSSQSLFATIVSEPSNPWVGGVERLYSQEFYTIASQKLAPGGIFAQWFHLYSMSPKTLEMVFNTFSSVFPHVYLFENSMDLVLLGSLEPLGTTHLITMSNRLQRTELQKDYQDMQGTTQAAVLAKERWFPANSFGEKVIHTLDHPKLSFSAGRDFFLGESAGLQGLNLLPRVQAAARNGLLKSLTAQSLFSPDKRSFLNALTMFYCRTNSPEMFNGWEQKPMECQLPLISNMVLGNATPPKNVPEFTASAMRASMAGTPQEMPKPKDAGVAHQVLSWLGQYGHPFLDVDKDKLRRFSEVCLTEVSYAALQCRGQLAQTFLALGMKDDAHAEYKALVKEDVLPPYGPLARSLKDSFAGLR